MRHELQPFPELRATLEVIFGGVPQTGLNPTVRIMRIGDGLFFNGSTWATPSVALTMSHVTSVPGTYEFVVPSVNLDYALARAGYYLRIVEPTNTIAETVLVQQAPQPWKELRVNYSDVGTFGEGVRVDIVNAQGIRATSFQGGAIDANAIGTDAIDADAIAADAIDASALAADAVAEIADAVLDEPMSGHTAVGSLGDFVTRMLALRQQNNRVVYTAWNSAGVPTTATVYIYATEADMTADAGGTGVGAIGSYAVSATFDSSLRPTVYTSGKVT
jgi:hypothetical protein